MMLSQISMHEPSAKIAGETTLPHGMERRRQSDQLRAKHRTATPLPAGTTQTLHDVNLTKLEKVFCWYIKLRR